MPTYVVLWTWTDQGAKTAKDSAKRFESVNDEFKKLGVTIKDNYWTMGAYDGVSIAEAADDATMSRAALWLAQRGNIRTLTARAYSKTEFSKIVESLP